MSTVIEAIDRFEAALKAASSGPLQAESAPAPTGRRRVVAMLQGVELRRAESALRQMLIRATADDHESVCEQCARGCAEGVPYGGTIYAPGFEAGEPCVIVMRRVRDAHDLRP